MPSPTSIAADLYETLSERMKNPFLSSFFISASLWNYKVPIVLIGSRSYEDKFKYIDSTLYPTTAAFTFSFFWLPLCAALVFAMGWPFANILINMVRQSAENLQEGALIWGSPQKTEKIVR